MALIESGMSNNLKGHIILKKVDTSMLLHRLASALMQLQGTMKTYTVIELVAGRSALPRQT
jgi:hypothetical protein